MKEATKNTIKFPIIWASCITLLALIQWYFDIYIVNYIIDRPCYYCTFILVAYACLSAKFEAYYYHYISSYDNGTKPNLHALLWITRLVVIIPIWILTGWKSVLCYAFMFPFFHDGSYYSQRNRITPAIYPKKWLAQSTTSTALSTKYMTPFVRTALAAASIIALILFNVY